MSHIAVAFYKAVKHNSACLIEGCHSKEGLSFHHVDPSLKLAEVGKIAQMGSLTQLIDELNKCVPLCWFHHKAVHKGLISGWLEGLDDKGRRSNSNTAQRYMPYVPFFIRKNPTALEKVYNSYVVANDLIFRKLKVV